MIYKRFDTTKSFEIQIINDNEFEPVEQFEITVTSKKNAIVLTPVILVTILCDEDGQNDEGIVNKDLIECLF